jgi:oxygen-independent coproporphyrinogen-3 oxidase
LGISSGGHIDKLRYLNVKTFKEYFKKIENEKKPYFYSKTSKEAYIKETIIMNLRLIKGLNIDEFDIRFNKNFLTDYKDIVEELVQLKLCTINNGFFKLTKKGLMLGNIVYEYFV